MLSDIPEDIGMAIKDGTLITPEVARGPLRQERKLAS